jgi:hypothetical protein
LNIIDIVENGQSIEEDGYVPSMFPFVKTVPCPKTTP